MPCLRYGMTPTLPRGWLRLLKLSPRRSPINVVKLMPGSKYSDEQIREGMTLMVFASAKPRRYAELAQETKCPIPYGTAKRWAYTDKKEAYQALKSQLITTVYGRMEERSMAMADSAVDLWMKVWVELEKRLSPEEIGRLKTPELLKVMHESAVSMDIALGKAMVIGGKPTQITENRFTDLQKALKERHGVSLTIEGEVVSEETIETKELAA